jgi:aerobic carbon-monoxide dehydrogenase large subunit
VNYVGDAFAAVVAESEYEAADAAQAIFADLEPLQPVPDLAAAIAAGAAKVHEGAGDNLAGGYTREFGDVDAAFANAPVTVRERFQVPRICGSAMEPRATTAEPHGGGLRVWTSTQHTFGVRSRLAGCLGLDEKQVEVLAEDVGGGFGPKATFYAEDVVTAFAALKLKRPVRWVATRSEDTQTTVHAHGDLIEVELAAEADGRLRGLRGKIWHDVGAYPASGPGQPGIIIAHLLSAYRLPALKMEAHLVHTNTASTGFVRGGGRPVGNFVIERLLDRLAAELGADPAEVRRRNLIRPDEMPYDTRFPAGRITVHYDSGDYPGMLQAALEQAGYDELRREQKGAGDGRLLGIGVACCVESSGWGNESARVRLAKDGTAWLLAGSTPQGQGHLTALAQLTADRLGWPLERVRVVAGDSRTLAYGEMTAGSRTAVQVGNAASLATRSARRWLLERAADRLEAAVEDLVLEDGVVEVRGAPQSRVPAEELLPEEGIDVTEHFEPPSPYANAYSSGCHVAVVSVDPETGGVDLVRYVIAADTGRILNPLLHDGQLQGGFAHGLGYALFEEAVYAPDGSFQSASFLDYTIPSAPELKTEPELLHFESRTPANAEGFKGVGESGTIPAPAAIANAVEDALRRVRPDARLSSLPLTPQRVLEALSS